MKPKMSFYFPGNKGIVTHPSATSPAERMVKQGKG